MQKWDGASIKLKKYLKCVLDQRAAFLLGLYNLILLNHLFPILYNIPFEQKEIILSIKEIYTFMKLKGFRVDLAQLYNGLVKNVVLCLPYSDMCQF